MASTISAPPWPAVFVSAARAAGAAGIAEFVGKPVPEPRTAVVAAGPAARIGEWLLAAPEKVELQA